jgi:dTDP-4-amino-4,6-dideoxygalactose transaminase
MTGKPSLAIFGAKPRFSELLPVGQYYWPEWDRYEKAARDIFSRRFYTSQRFAGPLVVEFQRRLQEFLGVKHAITVRNATNGLMIATYTLGLQGKVIVPSWTSVATIQALVWSKCQPIFCDIDPESQQVSLQSVRRLLGSCEIKGILGVHLWGNAPPVLELDILAKEYGVALYYDAAHAFGCRVRERSIGTFGRAEVFSFHAANILSTGEGGCITTNDDALAAKFTAMRGDEASGAGAAMQSATARMSELQAAIGMMMLDDFERNCRNNEEQYRRYDRRLSILSGIKLLKHTGVTTSNFQNVVAVIDQAAFGLDRDLLLAVLRGENVGAERYFYPSSHRIRPFSEIAFDQWQVHNTELAAQGTLQLPIGARVMPDHVEQICDIIHQAHVHSQIIKSAPTCAAGI